MAKLDQESDPIDGLLHFLAEQTEAGEWSGIRVWLSVRGTVMTGKIVSKKRYFEEWTEHTLYRIHDKSGALVQSISLSEQLPESMRTTTGELLFLYLYDVSLLSTSTPHRTLLARVQLDRVDAWGWETGAAVGRDE